MKTPIIIALGLLLASTAVGQGHRNRRPHRDGHHGGFHRPQPPVSSWRYGYPPGYRWPYAYPHRYRLGTGTLHTVRPARIIVLPNGVRVYQLRY